MDHEVRYPNGSRGTRTHDGFAFRKRRLPEDHDIVDVLPQKDEGTEVLPPEALLTDEEIEEMDKVLEPSKHESTEPSKDEGTKAWAATVFLEEIGRFSTMKEAAHASFKIIDERLKSNQPLSWMALDTTIWIENVSRTSVRNIYNFYEWRDMACENGWIVDGKWIDN
jgi:hypothetical protein